ncbi:hypothetical protein C8F04DRAFT_907304, partial [Mycena alexandri]
KRLVELDAAIYEHKASLAVLEQAREATQQQLDATSTFPVLTLPVEITTDIFSRCVEHIDHLRVYAGSRLSSHIRAPLVFLAVCRTWRDIALGTPAL